MGMVTVADLSLEALPADQLRERLRWCLSQFEALANDADSESWLLRQMAFNAYMDLQTGNDLQSAMLGEPRD